MKNLIVVLLASLVCSSAMAAPSIQGTSGTVHTDGMKIAWAS